MQNQEAGDIMNSRKGPKETTLNLFPIYRFLTLLPFSIFLYFLVMMSVGPVEIDFFKKTDRSYANFSISEGSIPNHSHNILTAYPPYDINNILSTAECRPEATVEELIYILSQQKGRPQQTALYNSAQRRNCPVNTRSTDQADS